MIVLGCIRLRGHWTEKSMVSYVQNLGSLSQTAVCLTVCLTIYFVFLAYSYVGLGLRVVSCIHEVHHSFDGFFVAFCRQPFIVFEKMFEQLLIKLG